MRRADKIGRPWWALVPTLVIGGGLAFLNVDQTGATVFTWFSNLTSLITLFGWGMICFSHIRFRHAWKVQGRSVDELPWKTWTFPVAAWWGLGWYVVDSVSSKYVLFSVYDNCVLIFSLAGASFSSLPSSTSASGPLATPPRPRTSSPTSFPSLRAYSSGWARGCTST